MRGERRFGPQILAWLPMMALLAPLYMTVPPSPDQSQFDWMAFIATQGQPYYAGSFDMNWPGAMWLHEAGIRLFGVHAWTWRLTDFLLMAGFTIAGALFLARAGWRVAPFVFLFLYPPLYITAGSWMAGQRDIIATGFLLVACALAMPGGRREALAVVLAGLCVAAAVLIRPTFLGFIAGLIVLEALPLKTPHPRRLGRVARAASFAAGLAAGIGAVVIAGLVLGNLDDWYQQSVEFSLSLYVGESPQDLRETLHALFVRSWHWMTLLAIVGFGFWAARDRLGYALVFLLGVAATSAVSFAVQNKGFGYHLGGMLPVLVLFVAVSFDGLDGVRRGAGSVLRRWGALGALGAAALLALAGTTSKLLNLEEGARLALSGDLGPTAAYGLTEAERREIITMISQGSAATDTVAIYGTNYELAYRAERLPTYRYFTPAADQINDGFIHNEAWLAEIDMALTEQPPAFAIVARFAIEGPAETPVAVFPDRLILGRLLAHLATGYDVAFSNDHLVVYRRRP